jgi:hypothetical protein
MSRSTDQIMPLLLALAGAWATVHFGLVPTNQTEAAYFVYVLPFAVVFAVYVVYQVARAPYVLDKEHCTTIVELERKLLAAREISDSGKAVVVESPPQPNAVIAAASHALMRALQGLLVVLICLLAMYFVLVAKNVYDQFPNPLTPLQISDLASQLRNEGSPQRVEIVREEDPKSIALAEQFTQIFESAHWIIERPPRAPSSGVTLIRGLVIWHAPTDELAFVFTRSLHDFGFPYQVFTDVELTDAGYFELTISDAWISPPPPRQ